MTTSTSAEESPTAELERADGAGDPGTDVEPSAESTDDTADESASGFSRSTRYRYLIPLLRQMDSPATIDRFVDPMLHWENELTVGEAGKSWGDIHEELFLVDLPVLDRAGLIEFDTESGIVAVDDTE